MHTDFRKLHYMGSVMEYYDTADGLEFQHRAFEIRFNICCAAIAHFESLSESSEDDQLILDIARSERDRLQETLDEILRRLAKRRELTSGDTP